MSITTPIPLVSNEIIAMLGLTTDMEKGMVVGGVFLITILGTLVLASAVGISMIKIKEKWHARRKGGRQTYF